MPTQAEVQGELPLTETTFYILLSLAQGPRHGYAILKDVAALSDGRVTLGTGTLLGTLLEVQTKPCDSQIGFRCHFHR